MDTLEYIFNGLMRRYQARVPYVKQITDAMIEKGIIKHAKDIENDHVAFRTLGIPNLGITSIDKIFLHHGYTQRDYYHFKAKKLDAYWYAPPNHTLPRVFISEIKVDTLSKASQQLIAKYTHHITENPVLHLDLNNKENIDAYLHSSLWSTPTYKDYTALENESEYASWVLFNSYYLNHYTISVHNLPEAYNSIKKFNQFLEEINIPLNNSGGVIKISADGNLLQSSTTSHPNTATFSDRVTKQIPGSYVEFAERRVLPQYFNLPISQIKRSHRREGFETGNADKIFESTYKSQTFKNSKS